MFRSVKSPSKPIWLGAASLVICASLVLCSGLAQRASAAPLTAQASPEWTGLTASQQQILQPLQSEWAGMNADRRQKWLEIAARFPSMNPENQQRVRERMRDWSRMTPLERSEARLVFQQTKQVPDAQRQAQWEAYQALPPEKKAEFAARAKPVVVAGSASGAQPKVQSAHQAVRSAPLDAQVQKSNVVVASPTNAAPPRVISPTVVRSNTGATTTLITKAPANPTHQQAGLPKITANPGMVDRKTLLPQRGAQGAAIQPTATAAVAASGALPQ